MVVHMSQAAGRVVATGNTKRPTMLAQLGGLGQGMTKFWPVCDTAHRICDGIARSNIAFLGPALV